MNQQYTNKIKKPSPIKCQNLGGKITAISGPIGAGKSTLVLKLQKKYNQLFGEEAAVSEVEEVHDNLLSMYIKYPEEYGTHFQSTMLTYASMRHKVLQKEKAKGKFCIIERPLDENVVFAKANVHSGSISDRYWNEWSVPSLQNFNNPRPDLIVFLYVRSKASEENMKMRNRANEKDYKRDDLTILADEYFDCVIRHAREKRMLVVDWNGFGKTSGVLAKISDILNGNISLPKLKLVPLEEDSFENGISLSSSDEDNITENTFHTFNPNYVKIVSREINVKYGGLRKSTSTRKEMQCTLMSQLAKFNDVTLSYR